MSKHVWNKNYIRIFEAYSIFGASEGKKFSKKRCTGSSSVIIR